MKTALHFLKWSGLFILSLIIGFIFILTLTTNVQKNAAGPHLPMKFVYTDYWERGYVTASGTIKILNEKSAIPYQTSEISCSRESNSCSAATAEYMTWNDVRNLNVALDEYPIKLWDANIIVFGKRFDCVDMTYTINRSNKSVTGIREKISSEGICDSVDKKPLELALIDGSEIWRDGYHAEGRAVRNILLVSLIAWSLLTIVFIKLIQFYLKNKGLRNKCPS